MNQNISNACEIKLSVLQLLFFEVKEPPDDVVVRDAKRIESDGSPALIAVLETNLEGMRSWSAIAP